VTNTQFSSCFTYTYNHCHFSKENRSKFSQRGGGVSYTDAKKKIVPQRHSGLCPSEKNFWNGILVGSITKVPLPIPLNTTYVLNYKCLGTTLTNTNKVCNKIRKRINSGNAYYSA
jgi:hypothetical protein